MDDCIFCKVIKGELPSYQIFEDDLFLGILDIFPRTKGHALLIPKKHYRWVYDVPQFAQYWEDALKVTTAMKVALNPQFVSYVTHGLEVPHAHIHIMPRYNETEFVPGVKKMTQDELMHVAELIKKAV